MRITIKELEQFYERLKSSFPTAEAAENFHLQIVGNTARLFSASEDDATKAIIDLESGILTTASGYRAPGQGANRILEQVVVPEGLTIKVDEFITLASNDRMGLGRITSVSGRLNSHREIPHYPPASLAESPEKRGDRQLFLLEGFSGGLERMFQISALPRLWDAYKRFMQPFKCMPQNTPYFLDLNIGLEYFDSSLMKHPFRPDAIQVRVKFKSTHEEAQSHIRLINE